MLNDETTHRRAKEIKRMSPDHRDVNRRDLVIGAVRGYSFADLRPFVLSLKRTSFHGDLVLLWNNLNGETRKALSDCGVKLVHFSYRGSGALNSWSRFWPSIRPWVHLPLGRTVPRLIYEKILNLAFVRYLHMLRFLEAHRGTYRNILLTDVRDVIFQDDPFRIPLRGDIAAFLEGPAIKFGTAYFVDDWLKENYGPDALRQLSGRRVSCCGTVMGTENGMIDYLRAFVAEIPRLKSLAHGADTSIHSILIYDVLKDRVAIEENLEHAVATIRMIDDFAQDADGWVLAPDGIPVPVVHQYDQHTTRFARLLQNLATDAV